MEIAFALVGNKGHQVQVEIKKMPIYSWQVITGSTTSEAGASSSAADGDECCTVNTLCAIKKRSGWWSCLTRSSICAHACVARPSCVCVCEGAFCFFLGGGVCVCVCVFTCMLCAALHVSLLPRELLPGRQCINHGFYRVAGCDSLLSAPHWHHMWSSRRRTEIRPQFGLGVILSWEKNYLSQGQTRHLVLQFAHKNDSTRIDLMSLVATRDSSHTLHACTCI